MMLWSEDFLIVVIDPLVDKISTAFRFSKNFLK